MREYARLYGLDARRLDAMADHAIVMHPGPMNRGVEIAAEVADSVRSTIVEQVAMRFPGFISASVHRSTDGTRVFNYLQWQTPEHLAAMQRSPEFQAVARRFAGLIEFEPHQCEIAHVADLEQAG